MYSLAIAFYAFVVRLVSPFHKKAKLMIKGQKQTFSILREKLDPASKYIWFHAASLGEFEQGRPMIEKIRKEYPEYKILLTFFSPSGYEVRKNYDGADIVCYLPFDLPWNAKKFLNMVQPSMVFFIKYEFWMNYLNRLKKMQIPTYIISAIFRRNQIFFRPYADGYRSVLRDFNWFFVQDEASQKLLEEHHIFNVTISGDTRFDRVYDIYKQRKPLPLVELFTKKPNGEKIFTLVAGSSWPKDEDLFISYFNEHPGMKLIIAPHEIHKEHLDNIISKLNRPYLLYSEANEQNIIQTDCLIIDCFGLLSSIYRYGEIAYIGGGFGVGIHNVLEAAVYGVPVIFGPNFQKFREARELIKSGGGFSITNQTSFDTLANEFMTYNDTLSKTGKSAGEFVVKNIGATDIILKHCLKKD